MEKFRISKHMNHLEVVQQNMHASPAELERLIDNLKEDPSNHYIRMVIKLDSSDFLSFTSILEKRHYTLFAKKVNYRKELTDLTGEVRTNWRSIDHPQITESVFQSIWQECMQGSRNRATTLSMDEQLNEVKQLLGFGWENSCRIFYQNQQPIGLTIPHLEPGRPEEGRIYFFGLMPEARGRNISSSLHLDSLHMLKEMGASCYCGSTHLANVPMQRIFEKNGCIETERQATFYYYF